jgi:hypothetical protein
MALQCAVCIVLAMDYKDSTIEKFVSPDFQLEDATTIMKGTAVCDDHMIWFDDEVKGVAEEIVNKGRRRLDPYWLSEP